MKLLFVTQVVDQDDGVLGAYHGWIRELAEQIERIEVICLYEGKHDLPSNVSVHSLGKESLPPRLGLLRRLVYTFRFKRLAWTLRDGYDAALVHMNQEYILIAGPLWKLLGKRVYMWRNHYAGSWLTDVAAAFCTKVFCTSRHSYTAKYRKTVLMPVGVDTERFRPDPRIPRRKGSILSLSRMAPSKDPLMLIEALRALAQKGTAFTATFVGSPLPEHEAYYRGLVGRADHYGLSDRVTFVPGVPNRETPDLYRAHEAFVNCSPSGMFDKTLFEAAASGCLVLAASADFAAEAEEELSFRNADELAERLEAVLKDRGPRRTELTERLQAVAQKHALRASMNRLARELL